MLRNIVAGIRRLLTDRDGVTAMEYGLIAAATVVAISAFMPGLSNGLKNIFSKVSTAL